MTRRRVDCSAKAADHSMWHRPRFAGFTELPPPHDGVYLQVITHVDTVSLFYRGSPDALIAVGAAEPEFFSQVPRAGCSRFDSEGDKYRLKKVKGQAWVEVMRYVDRPRAMQFPGAVSLIEAEDRADKEPNVPLPNLAAALERRYPGVRVSAYLQTCGGARVQSVKFSAAPDLLCSYGLFEPEEPDGRTCRFKTVGIRPGSLHDTKILPTEGYHHTPVDEDCIPRRSDEIIAASILRRLASQRGSTRAGNH